MNAARKHREITSNRREARTPYVDRDIPKLVEDLCFDATCTIFLLSVKDITKVTFEGIITTNWEWADPARGVQPLHYDVPDGSVGIRGWQFLANFIVLKVRKYINTKVLGRSKVHIYIYQNYIHTCNYERMRLLYFRNKVLS